MASSSTATSTTMRAMVTLAPDRVAVQEVPRPVPTSGSVLVRVIACGMCGSDVHRVQNGLATTGEIMGHEFAGVIEEVGEGVTGWTAGTPVAVNPIGRCGECQTCRAGLSLSCVEIPNLGLTAPGAYAEFVVAPVDQLVELPPDMDMDLASRAETLAVALEGIERSGLAPGQDALVFGVGPIGLAVIAGLRLRGAGRVIAVGRSQGRRAAAEEIGADVVLDGREVDLIEYCKENDLLFPAIFDCAGPTDALWTLQQVVAPNGTCVLLALTDEPAPVNVRLAIRKGLHIVGSSAYTREIFRSAVDHLAAGRVPGHILISETISLDEAPEAMVRMRTPGDTVGLVVHPQSAGGKEREQ